MEGFLGETYFWVKAFHIIFVIFWMAGLFMMPRYFAYHAEAAANSDEGVIWVEREKRLLRIIMNPSMILAWLFGLMMAAHMGAGLGAWFHVKLLLVLALTIFHMLLAKWRKQIARGEQVLSSKAFRMINEIPALIIIAVVILAVVKPF